jgi:hypothetical protein
MIHTCLSVHFQKKHQDLPVHQAPVMVAYGRTFSRFTVPADHKRNDIKFRVMAVSFPEIFNDLNRK